MFIVSIMANGTEISMPFSVKEIGEVETIEEAENLIAKETKLAKLKTNREHICTILPKKYVENRLNNKKRLFIEKNRKIGRSEVSSLNVWEKQLEKIEKQRILTGQISDSERLDFLLEHFLNDMENPLETIDTMFFEHFLKESLNV